MYQIIDTQPAARLEINDLIVVPDWRGTNQVVKVVGAPYNPYNLPYMLAMLVELEDGSRKLLQGLTDVGRFTRVRVV